MDIKRRVTSQNELLDTLSNLVKGKNSPEETQKLISLGKFICGSLYAIFGTLSIIFVGQTIGNHVQARNRENRPRDSDEFTILFAQVSTQIFLISFLWKHVLDKFSGDSKDKDSHQNSSIEIAA